MTYLRVSGIKLVRANGSVYRYHRATGRRIDVDPDCEPQAFLDEVKRLDAVAGPKADERPDDRPGNLGGLIALYKTKPEYLQLAEATKISYNRAFDVLKPKHGKPLPLIDQPWVLQVRDIVFEKRGRWLANMVVAVLSVVLGAGVPRGLVKVNAAKGIPDIRRPKALGVANKAWRPAEVAAYIDATYAIEFGGAGLRKAVALAYYAALRKADVVKAPKTARNGGQIDLDMINKNGRELSIFEAKRLREILNEPDRAMLGRAALRDGRKTAGTLVVNRWGKPYTEDGLDSSFDRVKRALVSAGKIRPGLTFHGLRKSVGKDAADLGFDERAIAGALGQANPASSRVYTEEANRKQGALRVFKALDKARR